MENMKSIVDIIGNTPLVKVKNILNKLDIKNNLFLKLESFNPSGSVKDRAALYMINDGINKGLIKESTTIVEATSGNVGISLAMIASSMGNKCIITMPENASVERVDIMKSYGAEVILTDYKLGMTGSVAKAKEICEKIEDSFYVNQFNNENNYIAHFETIGPEIYETLQGNIDIVFSSIGSGGTITGIGKYLKEKNPNIKIIGIEPEESPLITKGYFAPHKIQGIGASFIPSILDLKVVDEVITASFEESMYYKQMLSSDEGVFVGISTGASLAGLVKYVKKEKIKDKNIVIISPDGGFKYLSVK